MPVAAQAPAVEISPYIAYRMGGSVEADDPQGSFELDDSEGFGLLVNFLRRGNTQFELLYAQQDTQAVFDGVTGNDGIVDIELRSLELGGVYEFEGQVARPYMAATIGGTHVKTRSFGSASDTFLSGSLGLGVRFFPEQRVGLRIEARARGILVSSSSKIFCETGSDGAICAVQLAGDMLGQVETFAGVSFRF